MALTILQVLLTVVCLLQAAYQTIDYTRVLQRRSWHPERYKKWMNENDKRVLPNTRLLSIAVLGALMMFGLEDGVLAVAAYAAATVICLISAHFDRPRKAKKPLVYSARVKRLLLTVGVLYALLLALSFVLPPVMALLPDIVLNDRVLTNLTFARTLPAMLLLIVVLPVYLVLLANFLNSAVEKQLTKGLVKDAKKQLAANKKLTVIGITGSYGKTDMKMFLSMLLSTKYQVLKNAETHNTVMGVVHTIRDNLRESHDVFICEMGAKCRGDVKAIGEIVQPHYAVITAIGDQYLSMFKSLDAIVDTNFEIVDVLKDGGKVFVNTDNDLIAARDIDGADVVAYGLYDGADYRATNVVTDERGTHFTLVTPNGETCEYTTSLLGATAIRQLVGSMALSHQLGLTLEEMAEPVRQITAVPHRLQLLDDGFIDDTFNDNPDDFRAALDVLGSMTGIRRILLTPGMVDGDTAAINEELGAYAASRCDMAVLVGERQAASLKKGLLSEGFDEEQIFVAMDLHQALCYVQSLPKVDRQVVLLENDPPDTI